MDVFSYVIFLSSFLGSIGLLYIPISLYIKIKLCKIEVTGEYIKYYSEHCPRGRSYYEPIFRYSIHDKSYERQSLIRFTSNAQLEKKYKKGNAYSIWINEKKPQHCVTRRSLPFSYWVILISGIIWCVTSAICLIFN